jgi:parvulin-like peptidyl-prolyl isomerase
MSLMEKMRGGSDSFLTQAVFAIIVVSFVGWGLGQDGQKSAQVAQVDGERITSSQLERTMRWMSRGVKGDAEYASLQQQILTSLVEQRVLLAEAERLNIEVSGAEVEYTIQRMDNTTFGMVIVPDVDAILQASAGMFPAGGEMLFVEEKTYKKAKLDRFLAGNGLDEKVFREDVYKYLKVRKVLELASLAVHVPPQEVERQYIEDNTSLALSWVRVPSNAFMSDVQISQTEVDALIAMSPERIKALYDAQFERRYNEPRKATLRMILLRSGVAGMSDEAVSAKLEEIQAEIDAGLSFEDAARKYSEDLNAVDGGSLGLQSDRQMEPAVAEAVFAVKAGERTAVVQTGRGFAVFFVEEQIPAKVTTLEEAQQELARETLQADQAPKLARDFADAVRADWDATGQAPLEMLTPKLLLPTTSADLRPSSPQIPELGPASEVLAAASNAEQGAVLPQVYTVGGDLVIAQVTSRKDADLSAFEAERGQLEQRMLATERLGFQSAYRDDLVALAEVERYLGAGATAP